MVSLFDGGGPSLAAMTQHATKLGETVRYRRMRPERLGLHAGEAGFLESRVTGGATVHHAQLGQPNLLQTGLESAREGGSVTPSANQAHIPLLVSRHSRK